MIKIILSYKKTISITHCSRILEILSKVGQWLLPLPNSHF